MTGIYRVEAFRNQFPKSKLLEFHRETLNLSAHALFRNKEFGVKLKPRNAVSERTLKQNTLVAIRQAFQCARENDQVHEVKIKDNCLECNTKKSNLCIHLVNFMSRHIIILFLYTQFIVNRMEILEFKM